MHVEKAKKELLQYQPCTCAVVLRYTGALDCRGLGGVPTLLDLLSAPALRLCALCMYTAAGRDPLPLFLTLVVKLQLAPTE